MVTIQWALINFRKITWCGDINVIIYMTRNEYHPCASVNRGNSWCHTANQYPQCMKRWKTPSTAHVPVFIFCRQNQREIWKRGKGNIPLKSWEKHFQHSILLKAMEVTCLFQSWKGTLIDKVSWFMYKAFAFRRTVEQNTVKVSFTMEKTMHLKIVGVMDGLKNSGWCVSRALLSWG